MKFIIVHKFFFYVSTLTVIFPYFQFIDGYRGVQPYVTGIFLIIFLFISVQKVKTTKPYFIFLIPIIFLILNYLNNGEINYLFYRNFFSYLTFSLIFFVYSVYLDLFNFPKKIYLYSVIIWFFAALLQVLFGEALFQNLIKQSTTAGRGVSSLATEPSFFGLQFSLLLTIIYIYVKNFKTYLYILFGFFGLILSASVIAGWFYMNTYLSTLIYKRQLSLKYILLALGGIIITFIFLQNMRFGMLLLDIVKLDLTYLLSEESSSKRLYGAITPIVLSASNSFLPLIDPIEAITRFECLYCRNDYKLASYLGNFIFHFGFIFLFFFFLTLTKLKNLKNFLVFFFLCLFLLFEIPIAHPLVSILILYYYKESRINLKSR